MSDDMLPFNDVPDDEIQRRFEEFHTENPHVYRNLEVLAGQAHRAGASRIGMKMLFEVLRWEHTLTTTGDEFKLNNSYHSRYVRLMLREHPEWEGLFETRELASERKSRFIEAINAEIAQAIYPPKYQGEYRLGQYPQEGL